MIARMDTTSYKHGAVRSARLSPECRTVLSGDRSFSAPVIHRTSSCACGGGCPACQEKSNELRVSQPHDPAEQEADRVADQIMRMPVGEVKPVHSAVHADRTIHRGCDTCNDESETVQRKALSSYGTTSSQTPAHVHDVISSGGHPLDHETRRFFEPRLGYDLSSVRIHTDGLAGESVRTMNARAYALGNHIVLGDGEYSPETNAGKSLLAHELAHVTQDGDAEVKSLYRQAGATPTSENVWGFQVTRAMCACRQQVRDEIISANTVGAAYAKCDIPANRTNVDVEACVHAALPATSVTGSTNSSGTMTLPSVSTDPCQQIDDRTTFVHETMHSRHTDAIARAQGSVFFQEWRKLAGDPNRLATLRPRFPAQVAAFEATWNDGHDWAQDEVNSYRWERRFLEDVRAALGRIC